MGDGLRDDRRHAMNSDAFAGRRIVIGMGCRLVPLHTQILAAALKVGRTVGLIEVDGKIKQLGPKSKTCQSGATLSASSEAWSAVVAYLNLNTGLVYEIVVDGAEALTSAGAVRVTDAEIVAELPNEDFPYTVLGQVLFARSAGTVITVSFDHTVRSCLVEVAGKVVDTDPQIPESDRLYVPGPTIRFTRDAADIADGDLLTDYPVDFYGRIKGHRMITDVAITTAAKTTTPQVDIGAVKVVGTDGTAFAGVSSLGAVEELDPPDNDGTELFKPGDTVSYVVSSTTSFVEGTVAIEILTERAVF